MNDLIPLRDLEVMAAAFAKSKLFGAKTPEEALSLMLVAQAEGMHPAIAANPYLAFHTVATDSGTLTFEWQGDRGFAHTERRDLRVL